MSSPFLQLVAERMRLKRYAKRTIESYLYWIKAFINFSGHRHPIKCHDVEVECFLSYLTNQGNVAPRTQGVALNALALFFSNAVEAVLFLLYLKITRLNLLID